VPDRCADEDDVDDHERSEKNALKGFAHSAILVAILVVAASPSRQYPHDVRERRLLLLTGAYVVALAMIGFWRTPVDQNVAVTQLEPVVWMADLFGLTVPQSYSAVEAAANVVLFMPLGALVLLWRRDWTWVHATLVALGTTAAIEVLQQLLRPERFASVRDVVANTFGGAIGALLVVGWRSATRRRVVRPR
jgi:glycopeptide antibiotics resistance protein